MSRTNKDRPDWVLLNDSIFLRKHTPRVEEKHNHWLFGRISLFPIKGGYYPFKDYCSIDEKPIPLYEQTQYVLEEKSHNPCFRKFVWSWKHKPRTVFYKYPPQTERVQVRTSLQSMSREYNTYGNIDNYDINNCKNKIYELW